MTPGGNGNSLNNHEIDSAKDAEIEKFIEEEIREQIVDRRASDRRESQRSETEKVTPDNNDNDRRKNPKDARMDQFKSKYLDLIKVIRKSGHDTDPAD